jgi:hypothetical protein
LAKYESRLLSFVERTFSLDFSPRFGSTGGRAGLQPRRYRNQIVYLSGSPSSLRPQAARGTGLGTIRQSPVTAGLKPRPSVPVVGNPGWVSIRSLLTSRSELPVLGSLNEFLEVDGFGDVVIHTCR